MSRYRKVLSKIWSDEKFRSLSDDGQRLFLYHLTSDRATPFLLYVEGPGAMSDALRMDRARLGRAMKELAEAGMVWYADDGSNLVCLPKALMLPENAPESTNAVRTWLALLGDVPKTPFYFRCLEHWLSLSEGITRGSTLAFLRALPCGQYCLARGRAARATRATGTGTGKNTPLTVLPPVPAADSSGLNDAVWLAGLRANSAYEGIDIDRCLGRMLAWCQTNRKKATRRRFVNWLNREERPLGRLIRAGIVRGRSGAGPGGQGMNPAGLMEGSSYIVDWRAIVGDDFIEGVHEDRQGPALRGHARQGREGDGLPDGRAAGTIREGPLCDAAECGYWVDRWHIPHLCGWGEAYFAGDEIRFRTTAPAPRTIHFPAILHGLQAREGRVKGQGEGRREKAGLRISGVILARPIGEFYALWDVRMGDKMAEDWLMDARR